MVHLSSTLNEMDATLKKRQKFLFRILLFLYSKWLKGNLGWWEPDSPLNFLNCPFPLNSSLKIYLDNSYNHFIFLEGTLKTMMEESSWSVKWIQNFHILIYHPWFTVKDRYNICLVNDFRKSLKSPDRSQGMHGSETANCLLLTPCNLHTIFYHVDYFFGLIGTWWKDKGAFELSDCVPRNWFSEGNMVIKMFRCVFWLNSNWAFFMNYSFCWKLK